MMNKRSVGSKEEERAARFLEENGLTVIAKNFRCRFGEIDLIAKDGAYTVFVEVKYRKNADKGHPEEAVDYKKARTISKVADYFRVSKKLPADAGIRFDVIAVEGSSLKWYKNAFDHIG
jgi:putative endonuclease